MQKCMAEGAEKVVIERESQLHKRQTRIGSTAQPSMNTEVCKGEKEARSAGYRHGRMKEHRDMGHPRTQSLGR